MGEPTTFSIRDEKQKQGIFLIHGFSGDAHETFGLLPAFLAGNPQLYQWDIHCFGYPTSLKPDFSGVWSADPDVATLAGFLVTKMGLPKFARYERIALVAHSMGGLVVQRALLDGGLGARATHVALFGTPSNGLRKVGLARLFKRQARDMAYGSPFITSLRSDWTSRFGAGMKFSFLSVAGLNDEFVPRESSVEPFPNEVRRFVPGNHLEIVKPREADADTPQLLLQLLATADTAKASITSKWADTVARLQPRSQDVGDKELVELALALEATGEQQEAINLLEGVHTRSTELAGVLAGRLKRRWLADPDVRQSEGERALQLYRNAFATASRKQDHAQAAYNGINAAFMTLALEHDRATAQSIARPVLDHCAAAPAERWNEPTEGEANVYLGDSVAALAHYRKALDQGGWDSRELDVMQCQAVWAARLIEDPHTEAEIEAVFQPYRT